MESIKGWSMRFDISDLPIGEEGELLMALKKISMDGHRAEVIIVSPAQAKWLDKSGSSYDHVVSTSNKTTMIKEYYSPFGDHIWEVSND